MRTMSRTARRRHHVRWLFHSTAMVADYDLAVRNLATLIGLTVLEYSESTEPGIGRRGGMAWAGDNAVEIGQPIGEGAAAQFVERFGGGMHSIALQVENLQATMAHLQQEQVHIAARPRPEMCFSDPRDTGGIFFQWSTFELPVDPRFGAPPPDPLPAARVLAPATHHAFVGALVDDPLAWAGRFAALLGTTVTFEHADAAPGHPMAGVSLGDCTLALFPAARRRRPRAVGPHLRAPAHPPAGAARRRPRRGDRRAPSGRHHDRPLGRRPRRARPGRHRRGPDRAHRVTAPRRPAAAEADQR